MESATKITPRKALATLCFVIFGIAGLPFDAYGVQNCFHLSKVIQNTIN